MATALPYLASYKNVEDFFRKIAAARQPEAFTHAVLTALGFKSKTDRGLVGLLRILGFIGENSHPTSEYARLKNPKTFGRAIADAIRRAYKPLFDNNEKFGTLSQEDRKGIVAEVSGAETEMLTKINGTLERLMGIADFSDSPAEEQDDDPNDTKKDPTEQHESHGKRVEFHYNIQIHLPANGTEESYLQIFSAMKKAFA
jgi:hypothetical protein